MLTTTIILSLIALILFTVNVRSNKRHVEGLKLGFKQLLQTLPLVLMALVLAGMIEVLLPGDFVQNWLSAEAGARGIFLGILGGIVLAMGPYATFPIVASIYVSGAGLGTIVALLTSWCLMSLTKAPYEIAFLGTKFLAYKTGLGFIFSLGAGFIAHGLERFLI